MGEWIFFAGPRHIFQGGIITCPENGNGIIHPWGTLRLDHCSQCKIPFYYNFLSIWQDDLPENLKTIGGRL